MNVRLLRRVAKWISAEPRRLDMELLATQDVNYLKDKPPCGTAACIAGWACILSGLDVKTAEAEGWERGRSLLQLTNEQAQKLFSVPADTISDKEVSEQLCCDRDENLWPIRFAKRYENAKTARGRATATVARIEHFIATKGAE